MSLFNYITNLLGLKNNNIIFNDNIESKQIRGITYKELFSKLTYKADCCNAISYVIIKYVTKNFIIKLLSLNGNPTIE